VRCLSTAADQSRRAILTAGVAAAAAAWGQPALASQLRDFLQSRQKIYALAPIYVTQKRLQDALEQLGPAPDNAAMQTALKAVRKASLNCYLFEARDAGFEDRASLFQQSNAFADPCTFRLIAKNVTNLLSEREAPLKQAANQSLDALLRSFQLLDDVLERAADGDERAAARVRQMLEQTMACTNDFETSIKQCLGENGNIVV